MPTDTLPPLPLRLRLLGTFHVALAQHPLLADNYELWVSAERAARHEGYLHALERLARHDTAASAWREGVHFLRPGLAADPLRESLWPPVTIIFGAYGWIRKRRIGAGSLHPCCNSPHWSRPPDILSARPVSTARERRNSSLQELLCLPTYGRTTTTAFAPCTPLLAKASMRVSGRKGPDCRWNRQSTSPLCYNEADVDR